MLGLMSIMALSTMAITVQKREEQRQVQAVQLVGIPHRFVPFHIRCTANAILWLDRSGEWQEMDIRPFLSPSMPQNMNFPTDLFRLRAYLTERTNENRRLSYHGQQSTMILWVEPESGQIASLLFSIISEFELPLRIGTLPIMPGEEIRLDASLSH